MRGGRFLSGPAAPAEARIASTAIIGIVGVGAPKTLVGYTPNEPVALLTDRAYADLVTAHDDAPLARYLEKIYAVCGEYTPVVVMVNVFDPIKHKGSQSLVEKDIVEKKAETIGTLSHVTGVVLKGVQGQAGTYALVYTHNGGTGRTLSWAGGDPVVVDDGGMFELSNGSGTKRITAMVTPANLPTSDQSDIVAVAPGTYEVNAGKSFISNVVVKNQAGNATRTAGSDYTVNGDSGIITVLRSVDIATGAVKISYDYQDFSAVTADDIVGTLTETGRTGIQALLEAQAKTSFKPKIIVAPGWSSDPAVARALESVSEALWGETYLDCAAGTTVAEAIANRTTQGTMENTANKHANILMPGTLRDLDGTLQPASVWAAAIRARTDLELGFWYSISSKEIPLALGAERAIEYALMNPNCEAHLLNEAGILTVKNVGGLRFCGNVNASYPTQTTVEKFAVAVRIAYVIEEAIAAYMEQKMDLPIYSGPNDPSLVDDVVADIQRLLNHLRQVGAIVNGRCWFDPAANPNESIQQGDIRWEFDFADNVPLNSFAFRGARNAAYYQALAGGAS